MNLKVVIGAVEYAALDVDLNCWLEDNSRCICKGRVSIPNNSARSRTRNRYISNFRVSRKSTKFRGRAEDIVVSFHRLGTLDDS